MKLASGLSAALLPASSPQFTVYIYPRNVDRLAKTHHPRRRILEVHVIPPSIEWHSQAGHVRQVQLAEIANYRWWCGGSQMVGIWLAWVREGMCGGGGGGMYLPYLF